MGGEIVFNNSKKETIENEIKKKVMEIIPLNEEISEIEIRKEKEIKKIKDLAFAEIEERKKIIEQTINEIYKVFKSNYSLLTDGGRNRIVEFLDLKIGIRTNRPNVWARHPKVVIRLLKSMGLSRFIRVKKEEHLDKIAIANNPELFSNIKDLSIKAKEVFFVKSKVVENEWQKELRKIPLN